ncbi:MAG: leucine-rich repeat domain-containing protein [Candidatus Lokiarchaeota archaeon]|nr:leucine-rich repeat domain-containing protein [Candidatus Lokiarchaeota archaeon]
MVGLYFDRTNLKELPESIGKMSCLRFLVLNSSQIQTIPRTFKNLHNLEHLVFYNSPETSDIVNIDLPDIFQHLKNLKLFRVHGLFNVYIPPSFVKLENLEELVLEYCFFSPKRSNYTRNLRNSDLDLDDLETITSFICELPDDLDRISSLKKMVLTYSNIRHLPESIINLRSLKEMNFTHSKQIKNIENIFDITSLEILNLSYCKLEIIPKTIGNLTNLKALDLSWNKLKEIPFEIRNCRQLRKISLYRNSYSEQFESWIKYLVELPKLNYLTVGMGYFKLLPKELLDKKDLKIKEI